MFKIIKKTQNILTYKFALPEKIENEFITIRPDYVAFLAKIILYVYVGDKKFEGINFIHPHKLNVPTNIRPNIENLEEAYFVMTNIKYIEMPGSYKPLKNMKEIVVDV